MHSTRYIYTFVLVMTVVVAVILAGMNTFLKEIHQKNEAIFNKRAVLKAVIPAEVDAMSDEEIIAFFSKNVTQQVFNMEGKEFFPADVKDARNFKDKKGQAEDLDLKKEKKKDEKDRLHPLYTYVDKNGKTNYITAVRGSGLWDEIWGYIALAEDKSTIVGTSFDHQGETPGLGAEIKDNPTFPTSFNGKKILDKDGNFVSINVKKGGADKDNPHAVDGISGATVTCDGVTEMLERGLQYYAPALAKK